MAAGSVKAVPHVAGRLGAERSAGWTESGADCHGGKWPNPSKRGHRGVVSRRRDHSHARDGAHTSASVSDGGCLRSDGLQWAGLVIHRRGGPPNGNVAESRKLKRVGTRLWPHGWGAHGQPSRCRTVWAGSAVIDGAGEAEVSRRKTADFVGSVRQRGRTCRTQLLACTGRCVDEGRCAGARSCGATWTWRAETENLGQN